MAAPSRMRKESWSALERGQSTFVHPRVRSTATTDTLRTRCAPYGYYGPSYFSGGVFIGAGPWFPRLLRAAQVSMAAMSLRSPRVRRSKTVATSDADAFGDGFRGGYERGDRERGEFRGRTNTAVTKGEISVVGTIARFTREETSTAAVASMAEAVPRGGRQVSFASGGLRAGSHCAK